MSGPILLKLQYKKICLSDFRPKANSKENGVSGQFPFKNESTYYFPPQKTLVSIFLQISKYLADTRDVLLCIPWVLYYIIKEK